MANLFKCCFQYNSDKNIEIFTKAIKYILKNNQKIIGVIVGPK